MATYTTGRVLFIGDPDGSVSSCKVGTAAICKKVIQLQFPQFPPNQAGVGVPGQAAGGVSVV